MSSPLQVKIARAGKEVGSYDSAEALRLLGLGTLKPTDHYWHLGMGGWELLSKLDASEGLRLRAEAEEKPKSNNESKNFFGGCGLLIFLICGLYSVFLYGIRRAGSGAEDAAYIFGAISLLGLCIEIFVFKKK